MIQPSFYKAKILKNWPCVTFICPDCREDVRAKDEVVMSSRIRLLEENGLKTNQQLEETNNQLQEIKDLLSNLGKEKPQTYASVTAKDENTPSVIIIEKPAEALDEEESKAKIAEVTQAAIQSKAEIKKSFTNKAGKTVFICNNDKSKSAILPFVQRAFSTSKISTPKPKQPTISVPFLQKKYENDELLGILTRQNEARGIPFSNENSQVLFCSPMRDKPGLFQAVIRVSEHIRERIDTNGDRLYVGLDSFPVYDRLFIKRCNNCQGLHHFHKDNGGCKKDSVCAICAGNHDTRGCSNEPGMFKCVNCERSGQEDFMHPAYSLDCACYKAEQQKLKKTINYYAKNM